MQLAQYTPIRRLSAGGQGEVWLVNRTSDSQAFALKYLHADPANPFPDLEKKRFQRELSCHATLSHPNIMTVVASNMSAPKPFYIMPLATESLRDKLLRDGAFAEDDALAVIRPVIDAISYAHGNGVVHRDLKPENVLFINDLPVVSDFGLGRRMHSESMTLTVTGAGLGTLQYAAPEQFADAHSADERADVYALGKLLFELLTGKVPFPAVNVSLAPARFRYIINRCIENDPADRYQTVSDLQRELSLLDDTTQLEAPLMRGQDLVSQYLSGHHAAVTEIDKLLNQNGDDQLLYLRLVPYLPKPLVTEYAVHHRSGFLAMLEQFDKYVDGRLSFDYTDTVADFLATVFDASTEHDAQHLALKRVLQMGHEHNRWYVGQTFANMLDTRRDHSTVLAAAKLLRDDPEAAAFVAPWLRQKSLPEAIVSAIPAV